MNCLVSKMWYRPHAWLSALVCVLVGQSALGDAYYNQGVALYNQKNYKAAAPYFETAMRNSSWDSNAYYYAALTYQQLGDWTRAKQTYREIMKRFPGSQAANLAGSVLQRYDPEFVRRMSGQGSQTSTGGMSSGGVMYRSGSRSADYDQLPNEGKIYFQRVRNSQVVDAQVNGRPIAMIFDTGAEACVFGKNHLKQLGINPPTGEPTGKSSGVGSAGTVGTWEMPVDLRVGNIVRHNFTVAVQDEMPCDPLLGQTFFRDFEYTTDPGANTIAFKKKGATDSLYGDRNAVPFVKEGRELVVNVQINGRSCPMYFDTGADQISFSPGHLKSLGMSIPEDAQEGTSTGIGGSTKSYNFSIDRIVLGPIDKSNVEVSVVEASRMPKPLLGQNFFKDWQFTIDNDRHVIRFLRR